MHFVCTFGLSVQLCEPQGGNNAINESPLFLLLDPMVDPSVKELPIKVFESELKIVMGQPEVR